MKMQIFTNASVVKINTSFQTLIYIWYGLKYAYLNVFLGIAKVKEEALLVSY